MATTVQFQLTDELVSYLSSSGRTLANDFRFALIGGSGGSLEQCKRDALSVAGD